MGVALTVFRPLLGARQSGAHGKPMRALSSQHQVHRGNAWQKGLFEAHGTWRPKLKLHEITRHSALDVSLFAWYSDHALAVPARFLSIHWHQSHFATEHNQGGKSKQKIQHTNIFRILNIVRCDEWCMSISTHESCSTCIYPYLRLLQFTLKNTTWQNQKIRAAAKSKRSKNHTFALRM